MNSVEYEKTLIKHLVPVPALRSQFDPEQFPFETTNDLEPHPNEMIGQQRAEQAMEFGLSVEQSGYNIFVVGPSGTGRMTYTLESVTKMAEQREIPDDWCYVYNFENPDQPLVISFPAREGLRFQQKIETLLIEIERDIRSAFTGEEYEKSKQAILVDYRNQIEDLWENAEAFALEKNFRLERTQGGVKTYPLLKGKPFDKVAFEQLPDIEKEMIEMKEKLVEEKIRETVYHLRKMEEQLQKGLEEFMRQTVVESVEGLFLPLRELYKDQPKVIEYLEAYFHDVVVHFSFFLAEEEEPNIMTALTGSKEQQLFRYTVNLFVNNKNLKGAPVIYETNPTYQNLFGKVEYRGSLGMWMTDFTYIKPVFCRWQTAAI